MDDFDINDVIEYLYYNIDCLNRIEKAKLYAVIFGKNPEVNPLSLNEFYRIKDFIDSFNL